MKRDLTTKLGRIKQLCKWLIYKGYAENDTEIASLLGYNKSSFSQFLNEKKPITDNFIDRLTAVDKEVNKVYILTGEGEFLRKENQNPVFNNKTENKDPRDQRIIDLQDKQIAHLEEKVAIMEKDLNAYKSRIAELEKRDRDHIERSMEGHSKEELK